MKGFGAYSSTLCRSTACAGTMGACSHPLNLYASQLPKYKAPCKPKIYLNVTVQVTSDTKGRRIYIENNFIWRLIYAKRPTSSTRTYKHIIIKVLSIWKHKRQTASAFKYKYIIIKVLHQAITWNTQRLYESVRTPNPRKAKQRPAPSTTNT